MPLVIPDVLVWDPLQVQSRPSLYWSQTWWGGGCGCERLLWGLWCSPGAVKTKAPVVTDWVGSGVRCGEASLGSLGLWLLGMGHGMHLLGLEPLEQGPSTGYPDTYLFSGTQCQSSGLKTIFKNTCITFVYFGNFLRQSFSIAVVGLGLAV